MGLRESANMDENDQSRNFHLLSVAIETQGATTGNDHVHTLLIMQR